MFKVLNAYNGWSNVNYVLNDVKNPVRTLKISGPLGLGICAILYFLANVAFFAYVVVPRFSMDIHSYLLHRAATKEEIKNSDTTVAALFFENVFGTKAERALSVIVALR
jgi:solute carrier family 7 (L-type amino acid transporter), member 9/15